MRFIFFISAVGSAIYGTLAVYALWQGAAIRVIRGWDHHARANAFVFAFLCALCSIWSLSGAFYLSASTEAEAFLWLSGFSFTWIIIPSLLLYLVLAFTDRQPRTRSRVLIFAPSVLILLVQFSNPLAIAMPGRMGPLGRMMRYSFGTPWFLFYAVFVLAYFVLALVLLAKTSSGGTDKVRRSSHILLGTLLASFIIGGATIYLSTVSGILPLPPLEPLAFFVFIFGVAIVLFRFGILELSDPLTAEPILRGLPDFVLLATPEGVVVEVNGACKRLIREGKAELGILFGGVSDPGAWLSEMANVAPFLGTAILEAGPALPVLITVRPVRTTGDSPLAYVVIARDASAELKLGTESRKREEAHLELIRSKERFEYIFETNPAGMAILDLQSKIIVGMNNAAASILGLPRERVINEPPQTRGFHFKDNFESLLEETIRNGEGLPSAERIIERDDGTSIVLMLSAVSLDKTVHRGDEPSLVLLTFIDLSELEGMRSELFRAQKTESIGILAAGIGHDFNNIMTAIMGNISIAKLTAGDGSDVAAVLAGAETACRRARELSRQLLTFARGGDPVMAKVNLFELAASATRFALAGTAASASYASEPSLPEVLADSGQIAQAFSNIVLRALRRMGDTGQLRVRASLFIKEDGSRRSQGAGTEGLKPGRFVAVEFEDNGEPLPPALADRIFDPYMSSWDSPSGLGLAVARAIVRKHGGDIGVVRSAGGGALFTVYLPAADSPLADEGTVDSHRGGAFIVMDDELAVRTALNRMLEHLGYTVYVASEGSAAVARFKDLREKGRTISGVILDLIVSGGLGGVDTATLIRAIDPSVPIYLSSGYAETLALEDYAAFGFTGTIPKPFSLEELERRLNGV